jgi:hypothetical protein
VARVAVAFNVFNSAFGSYLFSNVATIPDPLAGGALAVPAAATASAAAVALSTAYGTAGTDMATANTVAVDFGAAFDAMVNTATDGLLALVNTGGGTCTYSTSTKQISGTPAASGIALTAAVQTAFIALFNTCGTYMTAAVTDLATANADTYALGSTPAAVTALGTAKTDFGLTATTATNGFIAIFASTTLTYTASTGQLTGTNPSSTETPTQAVVEALIALVNTAGAAVVTALADIAVTAAAQATLALGVTSGVTDTAAVVTALGVVSATPQDVIVSINAVNCPTISCLEVGLIERALRLLSGTNFLAQ